MKTLILIAILASGTAWKGATTPKPNPTISDRQKVLNVAGKDIGLQEKTGRNDGEVEKYIAYVGLDPKAHYPYCVAAISYWGFKALGSASPYPKSAWSPHHLKGGTVLSASTSAQPADVFGIYSSRKKRVIHGGLIESKTEKYIITREANTSPNAALGSKSDRDGDGVYRKRRPISLSLRHKDWFGD